MAQASAALGKLHCGCFFTGVYEKTFRFQIEFCGDAAFFGAGVASNVAAFFESARGKTMRLLRNTRQKHAKLFCDAAMLAGLIAAPACASYAEYAAYGYLTAGPTSEPEMIGVYDSARECEAAGKAWASRQVVGNPVFTECLPVDRN